MPEAPGPHRRLTGFDPGELMAQGMGKTEVTPEVELAGIEIERTLGRGGMGTVYLARQTSLDRAVAVKVLSGDLAGDALFLERLEREAHTMARLTHPHIVSIYDFQSWPGGGAAIVMEFVTGGTLRDLLNRETQGLPVDRAVGLILQISAGLTTAHTSGVIHRDIKPENILIDAAGCAKVTDFGLALPLHASTSRLTLTGTTVGTIDYMAPEQLREGEIDARADVFALGVLAFEMLTGKTPRGHFDPPHRQRRDIPRGVSEAVMRALRPNPDDRFADVMSFQEAVTAGLKHRLPWRPLAAALALLLLVPAAVAGYRGIFSPSDLVGALPQPGPWRDAIAGVKIYDDVACGDWVREGASLTSMDQVSVILLEQEMPEFYDVRMRFTRLSGMDSVGLFFRANTTVGACDIDAWREGLAGVQNISGESLMEGYGFRFPLENGRSYELLLEVRPGKVIVTIDDKFQKEFDIEGKFLHPPGEWEWNPVERPAALAIGAWKSPTRFESVEWRSMDYAIKSKPPAK